MVHDVLDAQRRTDEVAYSEGGGPSGVRALPTIDNENPQMCS
jgi:hypothetical protein